MQTSSSISLQRTRAPRFARLRSPLSSGPLGALVVSVALWAVAAVGLCVESVGATVEGKVTDVLDNSLPGVTIDLASPPGYSRQLASDATGSYSASGLSAGEYMLSFAINGYGKRQAAVRLGALDRRVVNMVLALDEAYTVTVCICDPLMDEPTPESTIRPREMRVIDPSGRAVPGVKVTVADRSVMTDELGHACFEAPNRMVFGVADEAFKTADLL